MASMKAWALELIGGKGDEVGAGIGASDVETVGPGLVGGAHW